MNVIQNKFNETKTVIFLNFFEFSMRSHNKPNQIGLGFQWLTSAKLEEKTEFCSYYFYLSFFKFYLFVRRLAVVSHKTSAEYKDNAKYRRVLCSR